MGSGDRFPSGRRFGRTRPRWATAALLVAVGAGACQGAPDRPATVEAGSPALPGPAAAPGDPHGTPSARSADACGLVTPEESSLALGVAVGPPTSRPPTCEFAGPFGRLLITLNRDDAAVRFDFLRQEFLQRDVQGVGDRAFLGNGVIFVLKGSSFFQLALDAGPGGAPPGMAENVLIPLARAAAQRA